MDELERLIRRLAGRADLVEGLRPTGDDVTTLYENAEDVEALYRSVLRQVSGAERRGQGSPAI